MTIHNRESFLNKVAKHLGRSVQMEEVKKPTWSINPQQNVMKDYSTEELIDVLEKQCDVIHTDFKRVGRSDLPEAINDVMVAYESESLIIPKDKRHEAYGLYPLYEQFQESGMEVHVWDEGKGDDNYEFAERADVGLTFSDITLAESGTITLLNDRNNARSISLLPKNYIAIIPKETIVPRLTQATKQLHDMNQAGQIVPSCVSFISGPSNSADIEMNLVVGVHGPIRATYIVVD